MKKEELLNRLADIEWDDFEVKSASGELPKSIWETVSAFSNMSGGWVVLGVSRSTFWCNVGASCNQNHSQRYKSHNTCSLSRLYVSL